MHDATMVSLSKIEVGHTILVTDVPGLRGFARPKDPDALPLRVTAKTHVPDEWSGKVWTLTLSDGTETTGRYGTTHVYVVAQAVAAAKPGKKKVVKSKGKDTKLAEVKRGDIVLVERSLDGKTMLAKLPPAGDPEQVRAILYQGDKITLLFGEGWSGTSPSWFVVGHDEVPLVQAGPHTTPKGREVDVTADGKITVLSDAEADKRNAGEPDVKVATSDRCGQCKGYGVVRKRGSKAGQHYRTAAGADQATAGNNSVICPACKGATILVRSA